MTTEDSQTLFCPLCALPHVPAATTCDACGQPLHAALDIAALRRERDDHVRRLVGAVALVAAMLALTLALAPTLGGLFLWTAPLAWAAWSFTRWRAIERRLALGGRRFG